MTRPPGAWRPRLVLDPTVFLAPGAVVVGDVTMGARSSAWFHAVLRGDTDAIRVGDDTNLQDHVVVHVDEGQPAVLGHRVTVGHRAVIHGCVIEDDCLIGMGALVLSGAHIGAGSLVAAGALVREGQQVPPGSVVLGIPAKVTGPTNETHRAMIARGAEHYAALARSYAERGFARPLPSPGDALGRVPDAPAPMTEGEWRGLSDVLEAGPSWAASRREAVGDARWTRPPGEGRWSAAEVAAHLRESDRLVHLPRFVRVLREEFPEVQNVTLTDVDARRRLREQDPGEVLEDWRRARAELTALLVPLGPTEWRRSALHSVRGALTLADLVRGAADHDLAHRRQIERALGAGA